MIEMRDVRDELWEIVSSLYRVENRVASLSERLAPEVRLQWESDRPVTPLAQLHVTLQAVLGDYLAEALNALIYASRQSEESLHHAYTQKPILAVPGNDVVTWSGGGVSFRKAQQQPGADAGRKEPPPCSD